MKDHNDQDCPFCKEPEDEKPDHWGYRVKIDNLNKRLGRLEFKKGELEGKVARLDEQFNNFVKSCKFCEPEPSSVSECKHDGMKASSTITSCLKCGDVIKDEYEPKPTTTPEKACEHWGATEDTKCDACSKPSVEKCETITISRTDAVAWMKGGTGDSVADHRFHRILRLALSNINGKGE